MKKVSVFGTGLVGQDIGNRLIALGYEVMMGSRTHDNTTAMAWVRAKGDAARTGTFADATDFSGVIFNCTKGDITLDVFRNVGADRFAGKTIIDLTNPLDATTGMPPSLLTGMVNTNSLGEEIQRLLPAAHIVKTLNIVNREVMVDPSRVGDDVTMFVCGNHKGAKAVTAGLLREFGWRDIIDLGDITASRGMEMMLPIWLRVMICTGTANFGFKVVRP